MKRIISSNPFDVNGVCTLAISHEIAGHWTRGDSQLGHLLCENDRDGTCPVQQIIDFAAMHIRIGDGARRHHSRSPTESHSVCTRRTRSAECPPTACNGHRIPSRTVSTRRQLWHLRPVRMLLSRMVRWAAHLQEAWKLSLSLRNYLVNLATDRRLFADSIADPTATAAREGLSAEDCQILVSGDQAQIYARLTETVPGSEQPEESK